MESIDFNRLNDSGITFPISNNEILKENSQSSKENELNGWESNRGSLSEVLESFDDGVQELTRPVRNLIYNNPPVSTFLQFLDRHDSVHIPFTYFFFLGAPFVGMWASYKGLRVMSKGEFPSGPKGWLMASGLALLIETLGAFCCSTRNVT